MLSQLANKIGGGSCQPAKIDDRQNISGMNHLVQIETYAMVKT